MANILVIDDRKDQRVAIMAQLASSGNTVTEAWDGSNAAFKADQNKYDIIISNLEITKMTILHFLKALRIGKINRTTPVILYSTSFSEEMTASLTRFGRVQFIAYPLDFVGLKQRVDVTMKAMSASARESEAKQKVYTFSRESLEMCAKASVETLDSEFFRFNPDMLLQVDPNTINFGIWLKGSKDLLEYVSKQFTKDQNIKHVEDIKQVLVRLKGGLGLYIRLTERERFYEHVQKVRLSRLNLGKMRDHQKEAVELFNKLATCSSRFNSADVDIQVIATAEQISMDMMQRLSDKPELVDTLMDLLRKEPLMFDFMALVNIAAVSIGKRLGLPDVTLKKLSLGCFFHDVGLAQINMPLIVKREMTPDEMTLYREHPSAGTDYLNTLDSKGIVLPEEVFIIMMQHHEKFNGTGFPNQKKGRMSKENPTGIHLLAGIVSLADHFALYVLNETQNNKLDQNKIVQALYRLTGEFDPAVLKAFKEVFSTGRTAQVNWQPTE
jgi:response regulator RpfG family c-di-GMP phosphodiesterase